jgi:cyclopropane fatty-acyl-phospholipid synthase-like methyltransferase
VRNPPEYAAAHPVRVLLLPGVLVNANPIAVKSDGTSVAQALLSALARLFHPGHIRQWLRPRSQARSTPYADVQLQLYAKVLPSGFLHYGYFADTGVGPQGISLAALEQAQLDYALKLLALVRDTAAPVLDIGCGMGGLSRLLHERGIPVVALTPDRHQAGYIRQTLPDVEVQECLFGRISLDDNRQRFGTLITSESLQYLRLDRALPRMDTILKPGGRWIACDYFRTDDVLGSSGHHWDDFQAQLAQAGFRIVSQEDITANVLPSLAFLQLLGERFLRPVAEFTAHKLEQKRPRLHYLLTPFIERARTSLDRHLLKIDPAHFARHKRYMLLAIERV